jgi:hypothetical protein
VKIQTGLIAMAGLTLATSLASARTVKYYGGDPDDVSGLLDIRSAISDALVFDDFNWSGGGVDRLFGNYSSNANAFANAVVAMEFEIRSGVSAGSGGTLVASGSTTNFTWVDTGVDYLGSDGFRGTADVNNFNLAAGTYFLALRPVFSVPSSSVPFSYLLSTNGTNSVGTPIGNGNSFFQSTGGSAGLFNYQPADADDLLGTGTWDFSQGLEMIPLPTGAAMGLAGIAMVGLRRRR